MTGGQKTVTGILIAGVLGFVAWLTRDKWWPGSGKAKGPFSDCNSKFLFIGDSLTAFSHSFADQLKANCPNLNYKKISKVGEKTDWMDQQLTNELASNKYDAVIIWGGLNDIYARNSISQTKIDLQAMYDRAHASGSKVIAITIPPTKTYTQATPKIISLTNELNSWIKGNKSVDRVIDANKLLNNGSDGTKPEYLQSDTLHLTVKAHTVIKDELAKQAMK